MKDFSIFFYVSLPPKPFIPLPSKLSNKALKAFVGIPLYNENMFITTRKRKISDGN